MWNEWVIFAAAIFAGVIRGYTGYGYSMIMILVASLFYPVDTIVPAILFIEFIIGLPLVINSWPKTDLARMKPMVIATLMGVPVGLWMLHTVPESSLKVLVPITITGLAMLTRLEHSVAKYCINSPWVCGFLSGWCTSAVSAGGAPIVIHVRYLAISHSQQRHTLISYFMITALFVVGGNVLLTGELPLMPSDPFANIGLTIVGVGIGSYLFKLKKFPLLNNFSYYAMISLSVISLADSFWKQIG